MRETARIKLIVRSTEIKTLRLITKEKTVTQRWKMIQAIGKIMKD